jgi:hypothetical protein
MLVLFYKGFVTDLIVVKMRIRMFPGTAVVANFLGGRASRLEGAKFSLQPLTQQGQARRALGAA